MRFEFTEEGRPVGAAQWEGPGQVSLEVTDPRDRRRLAEYFAAETTYLSTGFDQEEDEFQIRRRDWTPWEFERACHALAHRMGFRVERTPSGEVESRPAAPNGHEDAPAEKRPALATAAFPPAERMPAANGHDRAAAPEASA